jgi:transposase
MPSKKRPAIPPTESWQQLQLQFAWPEQVTYELIRPVVLFGRTATQRARETGEPARTIYRRAARFDQHGMASLFETAAAPLRPGDRRLLPPPMRQLIVDLRAEHPAFRPHEIAAICYAAFGRRPSPHTVQRVLAEGPPPVRRERRYPPYHQIADPAEARLAIIRLHSGGWSVKSIAEYLQTSRPTVYATLRRWVAEGVRGLADKPHARKRRSLKTDLQAIDQVRRLQQNPALGEFRIHAALRQLGIRLSPRTCGRILALNRKLYGLRGPKAEPREKRAMPFQAQRRHQYWTVDLRYIERHQLDDRPVYVISILDNYSRAILASGLSRTQDLTAYLIVLYAAIRQHGAPEALVSDGGSIFKAKQAVAIYRALGIRKEQIDKRQAWQSYIETAFNIQRRMADWHFAQAEHWEGLLGVHERWVGDYNHQAHWAHRQREDGRHSPAEVLGWVGGRWWEPAALHRAFYATRVGRRLDRAGYVRFRHWRVYAERGLAGRRAAVWLYADTLTLEFADEPLAQYKVEYQPDRRHLRQVEPVRLFATRFRSPQPPLWEVGEGEWLKVVRVPLPARRSRPTGAKGVQGLLFSPPAGRG